jgi:exonuclease SbcC
LPLDAPVVLIHGPNGTGKTSVLSAIELALTGAVQSLDRLDERYFAYLPYYGEPFAAVEIQIADAAGEVVSPGVMTVGPTGVDGAPALDRAGRQFYSERSYLDQVSLGRLLEMYQYTERNQESSLARFVNELLSLDQLDALISGLTDATDLRLVKRLVDEYSEAVKTSQETQGRLDLTVARRATITSTLDVQRAALNRAVTELGLSEFDLATPAGLREASAIITQPQSAGGPVVTEDLARSLSELRGRIEGFATRPMHARVEDAKQRRESAAAEKRAWAFASEPGLQALMDDAIDLGLRVGDAELPVYERAERLRSTIDAETLQVASQLEENQRVAGHSASVAKQVSELTAGLNVLDAQVAEGEGRAGALATGLAALREQVRGEVCPVCDRDYSELSAGSLGAHIDAKIEELTSEGEVLRTLGQQRDAARAELDAMVRRQAELAQRALADDQADLVEARLEALKSLQSRSIASAESVAEGSNLAEKLQLADDEVAELEALDLERQRISSLLGQVAEELETERAAPAESMEQTWSRLSEIVTAALATSDLHNDIRRGALAHIAEIAKLGEELSQLTTLIAEESERKYVLDAQVREADRRRDVAKEVRAAASQTRAAIVERVFNDSLNRVWKDVFVRLAPSEPFVPAFGIPEAGKHALAISLETIHRTGGIAGAPGTMLSAGNLNTAALSLFIALHLAVEPVIPCLVFDDPIQSMDEVHVAQFAGLLRLLSKQHGRQVVLAVHERELFQYLALELSPAFEGDELITIELEENSESGMLVNTNRVAWRSDDALAV